MFGFPAESIDSTQATQESDRKRERERDQRPLSWVPTFIMASQDEVPKKGLLVPLGCLTLGPFGELGPARVGCQAKHAKALKDSQVAVDAQQRMHLRLA